MTKLKICLLLTIYLAPTCAMFISITESSSGNVCKDKISGSIEFPSNCSLYYKCLHGKALLSFCPKNYWYNTKVGKCLNQSLFSVEDAKNCGQIPSTNTFDDDMCTYSFLNRNSSVKMNRCIIDPQIEVQWKSDDNTKSNDSSLPGKIVLKLPVGNQMKQLNLIRKQNVTDNLKVLTNKRGKIETWTASDNETWEVYSDLTSESSVSVAVHNFNGTKKVVYDGTFVVNKTKYYIKFDEGKRSIPLDLTKTRQISINSTCYVLIEEDSSKYQYDYMRAAQSGPENVTSVMSDLEKLVNAKLQSGSTSRKLGLELFIVLDYSIFYKWYSQSYETNDYSRTMDAIYNIRYFYTHVVNGINDRYAGIQQSDTSFYVKLVGFYIAQTPSDSMFTEKPGIKLSSYATEAYYALDEFEKWIAENSKIPGRLPRFDSAALFTDYVMLVYNSYFNETYQITGLANIGATCTLKGVSINKDFGQYATIETASHEIGHNLGAQHDGYTNPCNANDQFIMSPAPGTLTNQTFNNPFKFSSCSIDYFRKYVAHLDETNNNCLLNEALDADSADTTKFLQQYPGQKYSVDKQCKLLYGQNSFYCAGGGERDVSICRELRCYNPSQGTCVSRVEQRALDGTTCANKSWCLRGTCTYNDNAPVANDTCIYGDYKDNFNLQSGTVNCAYITSQMPWMCYNNYYSDLCCSSCAKIKNKNFLGCEYGDRDNTCSSVTPRECYDSNKQTQCCATCLKKELNLPVANCRYGDKVNWCSTLSSSGCYSSSDNCCQYCLNYNTNIQGCEFGDKVSGCTIDHCKEPSLRNACCKTCQSFMNISTTTTPTTTRQPSSGKCPQGDLASWCSTITPDVCYGSKDTCCTKCSTFYNPSYSGCEYGDKASWCSTYVKSSNECQRSEVASLCCASCRLHITPNSEVPSCPNGDQANYCSTVKPWDCYNYRSTCCNSCAKFFNSANKNCEYGDKAEWCSTYVQGQTECQRPEVASLCCNTCKNLVKTFEAETCIDSANWCKGMFAGFCYDSSVSSTCCATCESYASEKTGDCVYGDLYSWCSKKYCDMNAAECCKSCAN